MSQCAPLAIPPPPAAANTLAWQLLPGIYAVQLLAAVQGVSWDVSWGHLAQSIHGCLQGLVLDMRKHERMPVWQHAPQCMPGAKERLAEEWRQAGTQLAN